MDWDLEVQAAAKRHAAPEGIIFQYGTAGFRMKADMLDAVVFRTALLAALRSRKLDGRTIGVMITASHNPPEDNGIKIVDPLGEMLESSWEKHATELANAKDTDDLIIRYNKLITEAKVKADTKAHVVFARDTRASGPVLVKALTDGLKAVECEFRDFEYLTTPQLHYIVRCINTQNSIHRYGEPTEDGYYEKLASALKRAMQHRKSSGHVIVDCANGVGGPKLRKLLKYMPSIAEGGIDIRIVNDDVGKPEMLNMQCGADYVKTQQRAPPSSKAAAYERCASFDGDADRLICYCIGPDKQLYLLDGDRIATLFASFIAELTKLGGISDSLKIGLVQTAYANGASTDYVKKILRLPVECTPTGVKYLHHIATRFDIGVYFEANGHGTVLFSDAARSKIEKLEPKSPAQMAALDTLKALMDLINQTVGDAISDLLLVEVILAHKSWGLKEWEATYKDLPNKLLRIEVPDRNMFKTYDAERRLESPPDVQEQIDELCGRYKLGRAFARASGTEDAVRVYAEASRKFEADELAQKVAEVVKYSATRGR